tara:strand:+ start:4378 stop:5262 length:885 start_codon:yes stop_codon:yes gene_type:complete
LVKGKEASSILRAKTVLESTAKMGDYFYNVGESDFAAGFQFLKEMESSAGTFFLSSNLVMTESGQLAFNDHVILERNGLKIGVFGITSSISDGIKEVVVKDFITVAKEKINKLRPQVDVLVMLLNSTREESDKAIKDFAGIDYIFSSREASRTRPDRIQKADEPKRYCFGIQGKYIGLFDVKIAEKNKPIHDVTSAMMTVKIFEDRLNNLQKKNPNKPLEEVYRNNPNVLNMVQRFKTGVTQSKKELKDATNTSFYSLIALNGTVPSEKSLLKLVDQTLDRCSELDKEGARTLP